MAANSNRGPTRDVFRRRCVFYRDLRRFAGNGSGSTAMEYGLIASIIALSLVVFLQSFSDKLSGFFKAVAAAIY